MPKNYIPIEDKIYEKSLGLHIANGNIHDTNGRIDKKSTSWRNATYVRRNVCNDTIELKINADKRTIIW